MSEVDTSRPLKPAVFHILLALAGGESHGYAIMQTVREQSGGRVPLQTGSFYRHLSRLLDDGLVAETSGRGQPADPRRGTYYRITPAGRQALERERQYLAALLAAMGSLRPAWRKDTP